MNTFRIAAIAAAALSCTLARAGTVVWKIETDRPATSYKVNDPIRFSIALTEDGNPPKDRQLRWTYKSDDGQTATKTVPATAEPTLVVTDLKKPGFVRLNVALLDQNGQPVKDPKTNNPISAAGGAGAEPDKLTLAAEPTDFDAFWDKQKKELAAVPLKASVEPASIKNPKLECFDVRVDCAGGKPVSGYLVRPKNAKPKSLPAIVTFHGYGVDGAIPRDEDNVLSLDINAHGIDNGKPRDFYKALSAGELKQYAQSGNETPEDSYFRGMFLRVMRALEYVKSRPEWDGKNLVVMGVSQGGLQALAAAGLDPDVTFCAASKPWCCDLGGPELGRVPGWRPKMEAGLPYFDGAFHARRIKTAAVLIDAGLGDDTCPPSGVAAMFNAIPSTNKKIVYVQGATHLANPPGVPSMWTYFGKMRAAERKK